MNAVALGIWRYGGLEARRSGGVLQVMKLGLGERSTAGAEKVPDSLKG